MARTRVAPAAQSILSQATIFRPKRSRASDGTIGDRAHRRRASDHNPDSRGVVHAADLTHDPRNGVDAHNWIRWRVKVGDRRIKYAISNGQIWEPGKGWRRYHGENPHTKHVHVSVKPQYEMDSGPWFNGWFTQNANSPTAPVPPSVTPPDPTSGAVAWLKAVQAKIIFTKADILLHGPVKRGDKRTETVKVIQQGLINSVHATIVVDGDFGEQTERWVKWMQGTHNLSVTGVVDAETINAIFP